MLLVTAEHRQAFLQTNQIIIFIENYIIKVKFSNTNEKYTDIFLEDQFDGILGILSHGYHSSNWPGAVLTVPSPKHDFLQQINLTKILQCTKVASVKS